ncbi:MAG: hypothetical protein O7H41_14015 [Planctomycetota bacterium]|nr:hypothetical protein [Planctomycetota bacterium]
MRPILGRWLRRALPLFLLLAPLGPACQGLVGGPRDGILDRSTLLRIGGRVFLFEDAPEISARTDIDAVVVNGIRIRVQGGRVEVNGESIEAGERDRIVVNPRGEARVMKTADEDKN